MTNPPVQPPQGDDPENAPQQPRYGQNAPQPPQYGQNGPQQPQYGQNQPLPPQYGQYAPQPPQYGQQHPGYGQPGAYGQPPMQSGYPSPNQPSNSGAGAIPPQVDLAFKLILGAGISSAIGSLFLTFTGGDQFTQMVLEEAQRQGEPIPPEALDAMPGFIMATGIVTALITLGLYALVAFSVRKGRNWARILGTVFAALSVFGLFGDSFAFGPTFGLLQLLSILLGIAGIVLLYLPANAPYFQKRQPFTNPYGQPGGPYGR